MKMRKKLAALLAAAMIASIMPMTAFAASDNRVTKTVAFAKDEELTGAKAPELKIKLKDDLVTAQAFYLTLEKAEWLVTSKLAAEFNGASVTGDSFLLPHATSSNVEAGDNTDANGLKITRTTKTTLRVEAYGPINSVTKLTKGTELVLPIAAKLKGGEATIKIDSADTVVDSDTFVFATSSDSKKANVTVADAKIFVDNGNAADITFEEPFIGAFKSATADTNDREITIELRDSDFNFVLSAADSKVENSKGFDVLSGTGSVRYGTKSNGTVDREVIIVRLPNTAAASQRGVFTLKGVKVTKNVRSAAKGDVKATLRGELIDGTQEVVLAKYGDYTTKLAPIEKEGYKVSTGDFVEVEFKLSEEIENSLLKNRAVTFSFSKGIKIEDGSLKVKSNGDSNDFTSSYASYSSVAVDAKDKHNSFTIDSLGTNRENNKKVDYTFKAKLLVPNTYDAEEIVLTAEGRALSEQHEITIAKVTKPVSVEVTPADIKVGLQKQVGGKIVIKENEKETILKNYRDAEDRSFSNAEIVIMIDDASRDGLRITDADIEVTEGDLILDLDEKVITNGEIRIPVKRQSTEASTIEITNIEITANRSVPEGKYDVKIGGSALSKNTRIAEFLNDKALEEDVYPVSGVNSFIDPIIATDFINITTKNPEELDGSANRAEVSFTVGADQHLVNGKAEAMDATPYIKDGNTMVPVRYVATALGIDADKVIWDGPNQTATIIADKVVQVKLGSKAMSVNGVSVPMTVSAELTNDRTFVPMGAIARALDVRVDWDNDTKTATFNPAK